MLALTMGAAASVLLHGQVPAEEAPPAHRTALQPATLTDYAQQIAELQALAAGCAQKTDACTPARPIADQAVKLEAGQFFVARYEWFSAALTAARPLPDAQRSAQMQAVEQRLNADLADAQKPALPAVSFPVARRQADAILAGGEFQQVVQSSWWDRVLAWIAGLIDRALAGVVALGSRSPWIGALIEWGMVGLGCVLLLVWVLRLMRMQRVPLRIEAEKRMAPAEEWLENWMREAEHHAQRGAFRDAVHCLYWASITTLEARRLWHPDRARTPREYLRLLDPASASAALLSRQTRDFETIWYGLRPAAATDYHHALTLHRELRSA